MAKVCAFCGEELKRFGKESLVCGGVTQDVCRNCWETYRDAPQLQRCRDLLRSGHGEEMERVRVFLEKLEREEAEQQAKRERLGQIMSCCGQSMTPLGVFEFQMGQHTFFLGDLPNLLAGAMELAVFRCECCGQVKFLDPKFLK